ncbi:hypothetical protein GF362_00225, partial [Candidatus Dojkabacteria bacterium]|nr:hypothetical protein [Candidatus Dojkabacteria bacterium]
MKRNRFAQISYIIARLQNWLFSLCLLSTLIIFTGIYFYVKVETVTAAINESINIQGKITNDDGTNLTNTDAGCINETGSDTCDFRIRVYDQAATGNLLWEQTQADVELSDNAGIYSLDLDFSTGYQGSYDDTIFKTNSLFIQVEFDPSGNGDFTEGEIFLDSSGNRHQLTSVPQAYYAKYAEYLSNENSYVKLVPGGSGQVLGDNEAGTSLIHIDESDNNNTPNLIELEKDGSDVFVVNNDGSVTIADGSVIGATGLNIDFDDTSNRAQLTGGVLNLDPMSQPGSSTQGDIYSDSSNQNLYYYDGASWIDLTAGGGYWSRNSSSGYLYTSTAGDDIQLTDGDWIGLGSAGERIEFDGTNGALLMTGDLIPSSGSTFDLGSTSSYWNDLYLEGGTIYFNDTTDATIGY